MQSTRSLKLILAIGVLGALFPATAIAAPRPRLAAPSITRPSNAEPRPAERRSIEAILAAEADPADPSTFTGPIGTFISETLGWQEIGAEDPSVSSGTVEVVFYVDAHPYNAGDLDGDGLDDVLVDLEDENNGGEWIEARRGSDGSLLWRIPESKYYENAMRKDVTGDGKADFFLYKETNGKSSSSDDCSEDMFTSSCTESHTDRFTTKIGVRSGADGTILWVRSYKGHSTHESGESYGTLESGWTEGYSVKNGWLFPELIPSDNGSNDLLINLVSADATERHHTRGVDVVEQSDGSYDFEGSSVGQLINGRDGAIIEELQVPGADSVSEFQGAGDLNADGTSDLIAISESNPHQEYECTTVIVVAEECDDTWSDQETRVIGWDRANNEELWSYTLAPEEGYFYFYWSAWALKEDLTGDGVPDVYVSTLGVDQDGAHSERQIISGANGSAVWDFPQGYSGWDTTPSYDEGPGRDLWITDDQTTSPPGGGQTVQLISRRVDGATGQTLLETSSTETHASATHASAWARTVDDLNGDGFPEAIWDVDFYRWTEEDFESLGTVLIIESGRTGDILKRVEMEEGSYLWCTGDLDGDGVSDLMNEVDDYDADDDSLTVTTRGIKMPGEQVLWEITDDGWSSWLSVAGDQDGVPGLEMIHTETVDTNDGWTTVVSSLSGRDGSVRWTYTASI